MKITIAREKPFIHLFEQKFPKDVREALKKWDLANNSRFDQFHVVMEEDQTMNVDDSSCASTTREILFKKSLNQIETIRELALQYLTHVGKKELGEGLRVEKLNCHLTDMSFIQREFMTNEEWLYTNSLNTRKCMDEQIDYELYVSDEYRKAMAYLLWKEECLSYAGPLRIENCNWKDYGLVSHHSLNENDVATDSVDDEDDNGNQLMDACFHELLTNIHARLVIGGRYGQYEDNVAPYFNITKELYKQLVSVTKRNESDKSSGKNSVHIVSRAFLCHLPACHSSQSVDRSFLILVVDPLKKCVRTWLHEE
ncbi:hypothetical protein FDP41_001804 [Naegleria fowleri]|uniref:Cilia- and flagella-associated protein 300 n=1 Tax=Naegleria fowleri TaxID=5763 RepID=A0A6A5BY51_NAEFO|nr:uncharacterized protein FDP41_001804 [Naegleria fowleri]KAF0979461.1 hypothetical protein FDP41_001804 [Naegleria fowleri]CAG4716787.1 unnamed protein product [Naegleria fowleri]